MIPLLPIKRFRSGEIIFKEGDAPGSLYVIITGKVEIYHEKGDTIEVLATLEDKDVFGDMALISDAPRSASARAVNNISCYEISIAEYQAKLEAANPLLQVILKVLTERLRERS